MLCLGGIRSTHCWDAFQSSQCGFKIMNASKYSAHFPLREPWWLRVNTSVSLYCCMGHLFLVFCRSNWVRLLDSCAGTDLDLCCQDRESFFFLTPLLPECCYMLTVSLFAATLQWQNTRWALNSSLCASLAGPSPAFVLPAGSAFEERVCPPEDAGRLSPIWSNLKSQSRTDCVVLS